MKKQVVGFLLMSFAQCSTMRASAFLSNAYDGSGNRIARSGSGAVVLTNNASDVLQIIKSQSSPSVWALDSRKGAAGGLLAYRFKLPGTTTNTGVGINSMAVGLDQVAAIAGSIATKTKLMVSKLLSNGYPDLSYYFTADANTVLSETGYDEQELTSIISDNAGGYFVSGYMHDTGTSAGIGVIGHVNSSAALAIPFGTNGLYKPSGFAYVRGVAMQSTGALVYAGLTDFSGGNLIVGRAFQSGTVDPSFTIYNDSGTTLDASGVSIAVDSQDRIIVAGTTGGGYVAVARFNANGGLDTTFNSTGVKTVAAGTGNAVRVLADNSILVAGADNSGSTKFLVAKLTPLGALDTSFGLAGTGIVTQSVGLATACVVKALTVLPSGQIAASGSVGIGTSAGIMLLSSGGLLVTSFFSVGYTTFVAGTNNMTSLGYVQNSDPGLIMAGAPTAGDELGYFAYFAQP